jgi:hypothetical protein
MDTEASKPTVEVVCGSTAGEVHGLQVAQQVQGGGDQNGVVGAVAGSAEVITGSFRQLRCRRGRIDGLVGIACCNAMDAEH